MGCELPFTIAGSTLFIDFVRSLNSAYEKHLRHVKTFRKVYIPRFFDDAVKAFSAMLKSLINAVLAVGFDDFKWKALHTLIMPRNLLNLLIDIVQLKHVLIPVGTKRKVNSTLTSFTELSKKHANPPERKSTRFIVGL